MHNLRSIQYNLVLTENSLVWEQNQNVFSPQHGGNVVDTVTKTKLRGGITVLAANLTVGLVISSAVCIDGSCSSLIAEFLLVPT